MVESLPLPPRRRYGVLVAIGSCSFMAALDGSIVNTIMPILSRDFGAPLHAVQWVSTTFLLVVAGLMLTFGRMGDIYGHKRVYQSGFGLFVLASGLCGLAGSLPALVAARGLQAVGSAMILSNSPAILTKSFPPEQRGQALGMQASMTYLGLTLGPSLGGFLAQTFSWRAVFLVNLPVGAAAWTLGWALVPRDAAPSKPERFDLPGAALYVVAMVALLLALAQGHEWGWGAPPTVALLAGAGAFLASFLWRESRAAAPMLDLGLFRSRVFAGSVGAAVTNYLCVTVVSFMLPFYLIQSRGLPPARAGLLLSAQPIVMAVVAPLAGTLSDRIGTRVPTALGMALLGLGLAGLSTVDAATPLAHIGWLLTVVGLGTGIFIAPNNSALMGAAPRGRQGVAAATLATARQTGMMLGVAQSGAVFSTVAARAANAGLADAAYRGVEAAFVAGVVVAALGVLASALRGDAARP